MKNDHETLNTYPTSDPIQKSSFDEYYLKLSPESDLEKAVISSAEWIIGAAWGEPRPGHPEGTVIRHVLDVLDNVEKLYGDSPDRDKLRLIALIHDTFKYKVDVRLPKAGENHHAMIARRFAEKYIDDPVVLEIIQKHDDAFNAWAKGPRYGDWDKASKKATELAIALGSNLGLYLAFYECDTMTGDKNNDPLVWFQKLVGQL